MLHVDRYIARCMCSEHIVIYRYSCVRSCSEHLCTVNTLQNFSLSPNQFRKWFVDEDLRVKEQPLLTDDYLTMFPDI